jgi:hypothetical protein
MDEDASIVLEMNVDDLTLKTPSLTPQTCSHSRPNSKQPEEAVNFQQGSEIPWKLPTHTKIKEKN